MQLPSKNLNSRPEHVVEFDDDSEKHKSILPNSSPASSRSSHQSASDVKNPTAAKMLSFLSIGGSGKRNGSLDPLSARRDEVTAAPDIVALAEQRGYSRQSSRSSRQKHDQRKERTDKPSYTSVIDIAPTGTRTCKFRKINVFVTVQPLSLKINFKRKIFK